MDVQPFNRDGEQFSTFDSREFLDHEDSASLDNIAAFSDTGIFGWNSDFVGDLNEFELIQNITSDAGSPDQEPTCNEEIQKIVNEWQQLLAMDPTVNELKSCVDQDVKPEVSNIKIENDSDDVYKEILSLPNPDAFDLTSYITEDPDTGQSPIKKEFLGSETEYDTDSHTTEPISRSIADLHARKRKAPVKKIDMKAHRYIIDESEECEIDVETVSENSPVLEAGDLNSLLEQFEATELPETPDSRTDEHTKMNLSEKSSQKRSGTIEYNQNIYPTRRKQLDASIKNNKKLIKNKTTSLLRKNVNVKANIKNKNGCGCPENGVKVNGKLKPLMNGCTTVQNKSKTGETQTSAKPQELRKTLPRPPVPLVESEKTPLSKSTSAIKPDHQVKGNKQTLEDVPHELLERMKESGKRKPISVIPAIPSKKIKSERNSKVQNNSTKLLEPSTVMDELLAKDKAPNDVKPLSEMELVLNEHNYCFRGSVKMEMTSFHHQVIKKEIKQEPEFFMSIADNTLQIKQEPEEDKKHIICKQPMVKNADGKLMVSLLKVNTIRTSSNEGQKKKLNLEEYKKRREGFLKIERCSPLNNSPCDSASSSPLPEDEEVRRMKHQQKLMQMALEVLNTPPKSEKKPEPVLLEVAPPSPVVQLPPDMEKKTLVSIGVNTTFKLRKNLDPLAPVEQLEEIKPLLQKVSDKISNNSLITSVIENIPKVIDSCQPAHNNEEQPPSKTDHGEDRTIIFLPKNRAMVETKSVECQTNISLIQQTKEGRYRRRRRYSSSSSQSSSTSSCDRSKYNKRARRDSQTSCGSYSSSRSSRSFNSRSSSSSSYTSRSSSSRSRSRSVSPKYTRQDRERLREVEERRVIYVGRLALNTTRDDLRRRFHRFGPITNVSLHTRKHGDNYGFVTFANKLDAYEAIEHGNDDPYFPKYDLSFGGRRIFCQTSYSDLDNVRDEGYYAVPRVVEDSFDRLLREAQENMRKRKV